MSALRDALTLEKPTPQTGSESAAAPLIKGAGGLTNMARFYKGGWPSPTEGWPNDETATPPHGTFFDYQVQFRDRTGEALTAEVLKLLPKREGRGRRVNRADQYARVRAILANGFRCLHRDPPLVAYFRGSYYSGVPDWLRGPALARTVDALTSIGLLTSNRGRRHTASTYALTEEAIQLALSASVTREAVIRRVPSETLVRLYDERPKNKPWEPKAKRQLVTYEPTDETRQWIAELEAINAFLAEHDIRLPVSQYQERVWLDHLNAEKERSQAPYCAPELIQTHLSRVYNNRSFSQGGRMYGGWWQNVPKKLRRLITIDGQPTVELDFKSCHINMLYNEQGWECGPEGYELPEISEYEASLGLEPGTYRPCIKQYTQALINAHKGGRPSRIQLKVGTDFPGAFRPIEIVRMIERRHKSISNAFRSNTGLRLQRLDSDIAVEVVVAAMNEGWPAFPVHDSFIAESNKEERLLKLMKHAYKRRFGFDIEISNNNECIKTSPPLLPY